MPNIGSMSVCSCGPSSEDLFKDSKRAHVLQSPIFYLLSSSYGASSTVVRVLCHCGVLCAAGVYVLFMHFHVM